jgi:3-hydroxyisobutyrate dehydrogenase-like beta-hydroxyacid dehydrogenase
VAENSDIIITMLYDDAALEDVAFGVNGILCGITTGTTWISMETVSPKTSMTIARALEARGCKLLRAPVSGSVNWAESGQLTILASGDKSEFERCHDILGVLGKKFFFFGNAEEARYMKMAVNMIVQMTTQGLAEAVTFGRKAGVDWKQMLEFFDDSVVASPMLKLKTAALAKRDFSAAAAASSSAKDIDIALEAARDLGVALPAIAVFQQMLGALIAQGKGDLDYIAVTTVLEQLAGIKD